MASGARAPDPGQMTMILTSFGGSSSGSPAQMTIVNMILTSSGGSRSRDMCSAQAAYCQQQQQQQQHIIINTRGGPGNPKLQLIKRLASLMHMIIFIVEKGHHDC